MSKYAPLTNHLAKRHTAQVAMTFPEMEALLGFSLPPSARRHRAWWSNNPKSSVVTQAWLQAGYKSRDVDLEAEKLVFERLNTVAATPKQTQSPKQTRLHPLFGLFAGQIKFHEGVDLAEPADPDLGKLYAAPGEPKVYTE